MSLFPTNKERADSAEQDRDSFSGLYNSLNKLYQELLKSYEQTKKEYKDFLTKTEETLGKTDNYIQETRDAALVEFVWSGRPLPEIMKDMADEIKRLRE